MLVKHIVITHRSIAQVKWHTYESLHLSLTWFNVKGFPFVDVRICQYCCTQDTQMKFYMLPLCTFYGHTSINIKIVYLVNMISISKKSSQKVTIFVQTNSEVTTGVPHVVPECKTLSCIWWGDHFTLQNSICVSPLGVSKEIQIMTYKRKSMKTMKCGCGWFDTIWF